MRLKSFLPLVLASSFVALAGTSDLANASNHHRFIRQVIGHRPHGCPHAWCGCGLAHYLGKHDNRLNLAWNWARLFHRTHPHHHAAAVRHGHVMLLEQQVSGSRWLVRDYNGGHHLTWLHVRNISGYVIVDPSQSRGM